jgi:hypothetical protein
MKARGLEDGLAQFQQNTTRFGAAGEIVLSPPLGEQVSAQSRFEQRLGLDLA